MELSMRLIVLRRANQDRNEDQRGDEDEQGDQLE
jgi:hypothetical protein